MTAKKDSRSLHRRIQLITLICFLTCAAICFTAGVSTYSVYSNELMQRQRNASELFFSLMKMSMDDVVKFSRQAISNEALQTALSQIASTEGEAQAKARASLQNAVTFSIGEPPAFVRSVMVRDLYGSDVYYSGLSYDHTMIGAVNAMIAATDDSGNPFWHGLTQNGSSYLIMTRTVREAKNLRLEPLGHIVVVIDIRSMVRGISSDVQQEADETAFWLDDTCLYRGAACPEDPEGADLQRETWQVIKRQDKRYFVTYVPFLQGRIHVIKYIDYDLIYRALWRSVESVFLGMLAAFVIAALLSMKVINIVFKRLDKLTEAVKDAEAGNYRVQVDGALLRVNDEAGVLARHFQSLMAQIDDLINQKLKRQLSEVKAQNQMLQAQIRPHFLYNTLETVHAMAVREGNEKIARIVVSLSRLVRASYRGDALVSLEEEIGFVREYLTIYRIRFGSRLDARISYDAEEEKIFLPRMTLQPMIENSVQYGVMKKTGRGLIRLGVTRRRGRVMISLFDNGVGFTKEQIDYYERLTMDSVREIHGLANVLLRLRFAFGEDVWVQIRSRPGAWSNVCISFELPREGGKEGHVQSLAGG
ncbi:MAG: histidine kinase [Clostridia bacterium]|nr:histidine kinase [Clostridia bacterium]